MSEQPLGAGDKLATGPKKQVHMDNNRREIQRWIDAGFSAEQARRIMASPTLWARATQIQDEQGLTRVDALRQALGGTGAASSRSCSVRTKKGKPCPFTADRVRDGRAYCHVHDPEGTYQKQNRGELPRNLAAAQHRELDRAFDRAVALDDSRMTNLSSARHPEPAYTSTIPPIQLDPTWNPPDGCPFEPGAFHTYAR